ncbi:MAG: protease modulator HflC [bacterium]
MKVAQIGTAVIIFLVLLVASGAFYTLDETEQAIILQFGEPVGQPVKDAGLHFKVPFIQDVTTFEKRIIEWDGDANQISTEDKRYIWVNTFARWRIHDPLKFYQTVNNENNAQSRLDDIIDGVTRDIITKNKLIEVVRDSSRTMMAIGEDEEITIPITNINPIQQGRTAIRKMILARASETVPQYGIELIDVQIKHIDYIEEVRMKVYDRMIAERTRIAEKYRSEGQGERAKIDGDREKRLQEIVSEAYRKAQQIIGQADAEATKIYADSFGRDPEFYSFIQTLESYRQTMNANSTMILKTDSDYLKYLKKTANR